MNDSQGVYVGIGVTVTTDQETGNMVIVTVTEDLPGEAAGLLEGDHKFRYAPQCRTT